MNELLEERKARLKTAASLGTPDRVPLALVYDSFAANVRGVKMSDYVSDIAVATRVAVETAELIGDFDAVQYATMTPADVALFWLSQVDLPGKELPEDSLWQVREQELMLPEDYDRIIEVGYGEWYGTFVERHLAEFLPAMEALAAETPRATREFEERGIVVFSPVATTIPYEFFSGGRSIRAFMLDLFRMPDRVDAAMLATMPAIREEAKRAIAAHQPIAMWVGAWRSASEFLSPRLWDRFVFPYLKEVVDLVVGEGVIPVLHFDSNWIRDLDRFKELPKARCILALDSKTDIFRAKEILGDHICLLGDVSPRMLSLGTPDEVFEYSARLIREIGPSGYILAQGCDIPPDAKLENVQAMVRAAHT